MTPCHLENELASAISRNDVATLMIHLQKGVIDVDHVLPDNRTLLQMAVDEHRTKVVEFLIQHKCNVNKVGDALTKINKCFLEESAGMCLDKSNLYRAICCNSADIVRLLVKGGVALHLQDELGCTALWHAVDSGSYDIVEILLASKKCDVNKSDFHGIAPIHVASIHGHHRILQLLIRYRATIDAAQMDGATALCLATTVGATNVITMLLQHGADPTHSFNKSTMSPISLAIDQGAKIAVVEQLIAAGAQVPVDVRYLSYPSNMRGTRKVADERTFHWLLQWSQTPRSLKDHCALKIRQILIKKSGGVTIKCLTEQLPLPNVVKDYLHLKHLQL